MITEIVDIIVEMLSRRGSYSLDDIKLALNVAIQVSEAHGLSYSDDDYNDMFDDIILELEHPGERFAEPLR